VLSSDDPVRVFEQFAHVDLISGGRAEIMAGRGSFIESFPLFGYDLRDYDELFTEKLDLLIAIRDNERVTWQGKHRAPLEGAVVWPRPVQDRLPVWVAVGGSPESVVRAASRGLPLALAIIGGQTARFTPFVDLYRHAWAETGQVGEPRIAINTHAFVADSRQQAEAAFSAPFLDVMNRIGRERGWPPSGRTDLEALAAPSGPLALGSPEEVAEKIVSFQETFEPERYLAHMGIGAVSHADVMRAIELFGTRWRPSSSPRRDSPPRFRRSERRTGNPLTPSCDRRRDYRPLRPRFNHAASRARPVWAAHSAGLPQPLLRLLDDPQRVADLPECGGPEANEDGAALGVAAFVLIDGLGANPEADTKTDRAQREGMEVGSAQSTPIQRVDDHGSAVPVLAAFIRGLEWVSARLVSSRLSLQRRLWTAALWPTGIALTSWDYMWRTTPMHRSETTGDEDDLPEGPPDAQLDEDVQRIEDGVGPLFHRLYRARVREPRLTAEELISSLGEDANRATPTALARFLKVRGTDGRMAVGDELVVRMPGPWDGPVRVTSVTSTSFRFTTLAGHLEAGQIEFRATQADEMLRFEIESWARSGDRLSNLLYHHLRMAKEVQLHMWTSFLERVAKLAGGRLTGGVEIISRKVEEPLALS
jgi:alkanesulfonate monooxygenase SsuD/methylene tetrahydromethanopterin reductase-like flavin-dependent oxidoreductase (luciferase family)